MKHYSQPGTHGYTQTRPTSSHAVHYTASGRDVPVRMEETHVFEEEDRRVDIRDDTIIMVKGCGTPVMYKKPSTYLGISVISMLLFPLFGVPAFICSRASTHYIELGNIREAKRKGYMALGLSMASVLLGTCLWITLVFVLLENFAFLNIRL